MRPVRTYGWIAAGLTAVFAVSAQAGPMRSDAAGTASPIHLPGPPVSAQAHADLSARSDPATANRFTCTQRCDRQFVRSHQICVATIRALSAHASPDEAPLSTPVPTTDDCDRAARSGIDQCRKSCRPDGLSPARAD
ncbi:hypothetical protein [uncultured Algimonas sp.]|uniref:hypothetical protein n=1 Tax=uncultured Algimonas sp. TaxID=1547920 RepID=UPI00261FFD68|nr:hypothetical protein [uncultured Algimonas sp.]